MTIKTVKQFDTVVKMLGGPKALSIRLGFGKDQTGQAVHVWKKGKKFPAKHYLAIQYMMVNNGSVAAPTLFSFNEVNVPKNFMRYWVKGVAVVAEDYHRLYVR
jgi:hypothetical protein